MTGKGRIFGPPETLFLSLIELELSGDQKQPYSSTSAEYTVSLLPRHIVSDGNEKPR